MLQRTLKKIYHKRIGSGTNNLAKKFISILKTNKQEFSYSTNIIMKII